MKIWHVYTDTLLSTNEIVYVGKGTDARLKRNVRNNKWNNITKKHGFTRQVIFSSLDEQSAFDFEVECIKRFHTFVDDCNASSYACNLTPGGRGHSPRNEVRVKIGLRSKTALVGRKHSRDTIEKRANSLKGKKRSVETRELMSKIRKTYLDNNPDAKVQLIKQLTCNPSMKNPVSRAKHLISQQSQKTREKKRLAMKLWAQNNPEKVALRARKKQLRRFRRNANSWFVKS